MIDMTFKEGINQGTVPMPRMWGQIIPIRISIDIFSDKRRYKTVSIAFVSEAFRRF